LPPGLKQNTKEYFDFKLNFNKPALDWMVGILDVQLIVRLPKEMIQDQDKKKEVFQVRIN
jgi:hypothetical protein